MDTELGTTTELGTIIKELLRQIEKQDKEIAAFKSKLDSNAQMLAGILNQLDEANFLNERLKYENKVFEKTRDDKIKECESKAQKIIALNRKIEQMGQMIEDQNAVIALIEKERRQRP